jgi:predicted membrane protein (TIGR00267 family)
MTPPLNRLRLLLRLSRYRHIARRYFVTNGFDGALAMLGLMMGFRVSGEVQVHTALSACIGAAVALMMSGLSSAYVSEAAERRRELKELEAAMLDDMQASAHARAARFTPLVIAAVNGMAPLLTALVIISPLILVELGVPLRWPPIETAIALAFVVIFLLGVYIGRVSGGFWLWSALRTVFIAAVTSGIILVLEL